MRWSFIGAPTTSVTPSSPHSACSAGWSPVAGPYYLSGGYFEYWEARANLQTTKLFRLQLTGALVLSQPPGLLIRQTPDAVVVYWSTNYIGYSLESTLGIARRRVVSVAGPYYLSGGYFEYWEARANLQTTKLFRLQLTGGLVLSRLPALAIQLQMNTLAISWPAALAGFTLETTTNLVPPADLVAGNEQSRHGDQRPDRVSPKPRPSHFMPVLPAAWAMNWVTQAGQAFRQERGCAGLKRLLARR